VLVLEVPGALLGSEYSMMNVDYPDKPTESVQPVLKVQFRHLNCICQSLVCSSCDLL
jgi:hypothetical protein